MKKIGIIFSILAMAGAAFGQGAIIFNNRVVGSVVAPIYDVNPLSPGVGKHGNATTNGGAVDYTGHPLIIGTGYTAALFYVNAGNPGLGFQLVQQIPFRTTATTGGFVANTATAPTITGGPYDGASAVTPTMFQVRAWNNLTGTVQTWADALANPLVAKGQSDVFTAPVNSSPLLAGPLTGLTSFNLTIVPEPGVIALGVLGLGALLLRRRK